MGPLRAAPEPLRKTAADRPVMSVPKDESMANPARQLGRTDTPPDLLGNSDSFFRLIVNKPQAQIVL